VERLNLYETLGVGRHDSAVAVRSAYRDLARLSHATIDAAPHFVREMDLAVEVLSDGARRAHYDDVVRGQPAPADKPRRERQLDLIRDFEGGRPTRDEVRGLFRRSFGPAEEPKSGRVMVLDLRIGIAGPDPDAADVLCLAVPVFHACAVCHGTGSVGQLACSSCAGDGVAEERWPVRTPVSPGERTIGLAEIGVRTLILHLELTARAQVH
jgi:DnaJ-class molecular chaperone